MTERRITTGSSADNGHDPQARLKQIAGLIKNLPYRDMCQFGNDLRFCINKRVGEGSRCAPVGADDVTEGLLAWAEEKAF